MADLPHPSRSSSLEDDEAPDAYTVFLSTLKTEEGTDDGLTPAEKRIKIEEPSTSEDDSIEVDEWTEPQYSSLPSGPPVEAVGGSAERRIRDEQIKTEVKKEVLIKSEPLEEKENLGENKPSIKSSPVFAKSERYRRAFANALDFVKDVKRELFFTNPYAYKQFLDIFEKSKRNRHDLSDRLRVVAEAKELIGHRTDLMQRLVDMAMSDLSADQPLRPLQPLVTDGRGVKLENMGYQVKKE